MKIVEILKEGSSHVYASAEEVTVRSFADPDKVNLQEYLDKSAIVIDCIDLDSARSLLKRIRTDEQDGIALKPVFLISPEEVKDPYLLSLSDGIADPSDVSKVGYQIRKIQERNSRLEPLTGGSFELHLMLRLLRYLYTRNRGLEPVMDKDSMHGYTYPEVVVNFSCDDGHRVFDILDLAEKEGFLEGTFVDNVNLCDRCFSAFLNFREVCPKCASPDLKTEDLVHHFACAYVGPESDFKKGEGDEMLCPKCSKNVRHIGVDYDKPAVIYTCYRCREKFQDPKVKALCFNCQNDTLVENLIDKKIRSYRLTTKGEHAAIYGASISMKEIIKVPGLVDYDVFSKYLRCEVERFKRVSRNGCTAYLQFSNFNELYIRGATKERIFSEIVDLIKVSVRPSDLISYLNEATLLFFFTDTPVEAAGIPIERLKSNLVKLVHDNFSGLEPRIYTDIQPLDKVFSLEDFVKRIPSP